MKWSCSRWALTMPHWHAVALMSCGCVVTSILLSLTVVSMLGVDEEVFRDTIWISAVVPALVATPTIHIMVSLARELDAARHEAQRLANTDVLTGVQNRRRFLDCARRELASAQQSGKPTALLLLDVDDFKNINDSVGHDAGDAVLQAVAQSCAGVLRPADLLARWGGEEFVVLLRETHQREAMQTALKIKEAIRRSAVPVPVGASVGVTASIGVAISTQTESLEAVVMRADQAMYAAKRSGKNSVVAAEDGPVDLTESLKASLTALQLPPAIQQPAELT